MQSIAEEEAVRLAEEEEEEAVRLAAAAGGRGETSMAGIFLKRKMVRTRRLPARSHLAPLRLRQCYYSDCQIITLSSDGTVRCIIL